MFASLASKSYRSYYYNGLEMQTNLIQHQINIGNHSPIKQVPRRVPLAKHEEMESLIESTKGPGITGPSSSLWSSPVPLVPKKDGTTRFWMDYRKLNEVTRKDRYPLPRINNIFNVFHRAKWFCTLDLKSGYWQVDVGSPY